MYLNQGLRLHGVPSPIVPLYGTSTTYLQQFAAAQPSIYSNPAPSSAARRYQRLHILERIDEVICRLGKRNSRISRRHVGRE